MDVVAGALAAAFGHSAVAHTAFVARSQYLLNQEEFKSRRMPKFFERMVYLAALPSPSPDIGYYAHCYSYVRACLSALSVH